MLDPNRDVHPHSLSYSLITNDGRTLAGTIGQETIVQETATSLTLRRADNATDTVLHIDIDELRSSGLSLMPAGMEKQIDKQARADRIAYLQSID